ncbi:MAG TPA: heavy metal translocating P-type ATPase [Vitreimonas sp.]|nr:heavy metal translocating P-type ATPase [Vitreimonas sp.]
MASRATNHQHADHQADTVTTSLPVEGMHCASCAQIIQRTLGKVEGVESCTVNFATEKAYVEYHPDQVNPAQLSEKIKPYGYNLHIPTDVHAESGQLHPVTHSGHDGHAAPSTQAAVTAEKEQVTLTLPLALLVFMVMLWEIATKIWWWWLPLPWPMPLLNGFLFLLATGFMVTIGRPFMTAVGMYLKTGHANMDTLVGIGTTVAYVFSSFVFLFPATIQRLGLAEYLYFDVVIVVLAFIKLGKYLEVSSKHKTGEALEKLLHLQAKTALVYRDGEEIEIAVEHVQIGDHIVVKPGSKIPVDGKVIKGHSSVDESLVTGESLPVDKNPGDIVISGTLNKQGMLIFEATQVGEQTLLAQIVKLVENAQGTKAPIERLADQVSSVFVPVVLIVAVVTLLTWLVGGSLYLPVSQAVTLGLLSFVSILVIACPCALGLATPTALIVGVGRAASQGILIKDAESLEKLHQVSVVVMDKTGTLTEGKPQVVSVTTLSALSESQVVSMLAALEQHSEHPLAQAVLSEAKRRRVEHAEVKDFEILEGWGLRGKINKTEYWAGKPTLLSQYKLKIDQSLVDAATAEGKTPIVLFTKQEVKGIVWVADAVKANAAEAVTKLHNLGIKVVLASGDHSNTSQYIAQQVGITQVYGEVLPQAKAELVKKLQAEGEVVAMVGDGVNDAPALAQADVGIAMSTGTDVALSAASITLLKGDVAKLEAALALSRATMRVIKQNLFWAFIYNLLGIPLAAGLLYPILGLVLNPVFAGLAMALSSVSVVINSLRLKSVKI